MAASNAGDTVEGATADGFLAPFPKPAFDQVSPRGAGGSKVEVTARLSFQPSLHLGVLVGAVVVQNEMKGEFLWRTLIPEAQELQKLLMAVPRQALTNDFACQNFARRKQGRRAVAHIVVGLSATPTVLERQPGLRAIERLDLALLIHAAPHGLVRRIEIDPHEAGEFLDQALVAGKLEGASQVWLASVPLPEALHALKTPSLGFGQEAATPVGPPFRLGFNGGAHHCRYLG